MTIEERSFQHTGQLLLTVLHKDRNRQTVPDNSACPISEQLKRSQKARNYHKKMAGRVVYKSNQDD
jgi:hypothetical protein